MSEKNMTNLCGVAWHAQPCPQLCNPVARSPPGSSVHGILQASMLEWVAISYSRASSWYRDWTCVSFISCIGRWVLYHCTTWESHDKHRQCIKNQRHPFANRGPHTHRYGFSSGPVWMWGLDHKEHWAPMNWCFLTVVLQKTLRVPGTAWRSNQSIPKESATEYSLEGLILKLEIEDRRKRGWQRIRWLDGIIDSMDMSLSKLSEIAKDRKPGMPHAMGHKESVMT